MKGWLIGGAVSVLMLIVAPFVLLAVYLKVEDAPRGSFLYHTGIPGYVKAMPVLEVCGDDPLYSYEGRDGERTAFGDVTYRSALAVSDAKDVMTKALVPLGCDLRDSYASGQSFTCGLYLSVNVTMIAGDECTDLRISLVGDGPLPAMQ
ncbi:hypothetical protein [Yoonia sp. 208BN28-4]|uniref:hypothetical protein n=1 Tax=Yoonia sp. 208BN28-4 TaxID=3126505 RepID=UPI0030A24052